MRLFYLLALTLWTLGGIDATERLMAQDLNFRVEATFEGDTLARAIEERVALLQSQLESDATVDEENRQQIATLLRSAQVNGEQIESIVAVLVKQEQAAASAEDKAAQRLADLQALRESEPERLPEKMMLTDLERATANAKRAVEGLKEELVTIDSRLAGRNESGLNLDSELEAVTERLKRLEEKADTLPPASKSLKTEAVRLETSSAIAKLKCERDAIKAQQQRQDAEDAANLLRHQRDLEAERLQRAETTLDALQKMLDEARQQKAKKLAATAVEKQKTIAEKYPQLLSSYEANTQLALRGQQVEQQAQEVTQKRDDLKRRLEELKTLKRETETRVDKIGLSGAVGAMLRKRRGEMVAYVSTYSNTEAVKEELDEIQFEIIDIQEQRSALSIGVVRTEIEAAIGERLSDARFESIEKPVGELIAARRERLAAVSDSLNRMFDLITDIQATESDLKKIRSEFREYINERILWIRSNDFLFSELELDASDRAILDPAPWTNVLARIGQVLNRWSMYYSMSALVILLMLITKKRMRDEIDRQGQIASKGACDSFWPTLHTLFWSVMIGITLPLTPLLLGMGMLWASPSGNTLFDSVGTGLLACAWFTFPMEILRGMCRPKGLANVHFDWPNNAVKHLKRNLDWMISPSAITVFAIAVLLNLEAAHRVDLIERSLFVVGMGILDYFLFRTFNPSTGIFAEYLKSHEKSWANQVSMVWFGFMLLVPVALATLAIWGYYYTALNLSRCIYATFVFALIVETIRAMMRRLILLGRRRVHIATARRKRALQIEAQQEAIKAEEEVQKVLRVAKLKAEADAAARAKEGGKASQALGDSSAAVDTSKLPAPATAPVPSVESLLEMRPANDIDEDALRATKLIGLVMMIAWAIGLWMIWADVLPALKYLDGITLWQTNVAQSVSQGDSAIEVPSAMPMPGMSSPSAGNSIVVNGKKWVTFRDLLSSIMIALLTLVGARNLPAAIEMLFLDHLPVDRSFRYATKALTSYAIIMLGIVFAFGALSISWDNVQWLATALTFGLAFGLQEIFANFVAGIILMFERPIRIGDWITVDEYTGVVTKIRTRATTIVNWDRKEYVIPNKDFITGRLVNWTLSDSINRIVINVGVAYGSDVVKAKKILLEVCNSHPKTVSDPPTVVAFEAFADSSLSLVVRTFILDVESRIAVIDDLHTQINQAFLDAGIEISFPQRDLHVRSIDAAAVASFVTRDQVKS